ncbi:MAG TPA: Crp/Fnr family transcriptional regulator [Candidatus Acidoferrales bacterium]|nr:Crp/Fnr family transcriptional regulator [Candidatus Acidoferrales bacterium]
MGQPANPTDHRRNRSYLNNAEETSLRNKILLAIPESEYGVVEPLLEPCPLRQQSVLHEPTEKLEFTYFPNCGLISLLIATEDGKTVEAGMVGSEGVAGVASAVGLNASPLRFVVQIPGDGFRLKVSALQARLSSLPQLQMLVSRFAVIQGMQVAQTAACNRLHEVGERLACWLLLAADHVESNSLPVTHDFLATSLGTDRPSVSLAAKALQKKKIIQYRRGTVEILQRKRLEASACECYRVVRQLNGMLRPK